MTKNNTPQIGDTVGIIQANMPKGTIGEARYKLVSLNGSQCEIAETYTNEDGQEKFYSPQRFHTSMIAKA